MVELADTRDSKSRAPKGVPVRARFSVSKIKITKNCYDVKLYFRVDRYPMSPRCGWQDGADTKCFELETLLGSCNLIGLYG